MYKTQTFHRHDMLLPSEVILMRKEIQQRLRIPFLKTIGYAVVGLLVVVVIIILGVGGELPPDRGHTWGFVLVAIGIFFRCGIHASQAKSMWNCRNLRKKYVFCGHYIAGPDEAGICRFQMEDIMIIMQTPRIKELSFVAPALDKLVPEQLVMIYAMESPVVIFSVEPLLSFSEIETQPTFH